MERFILTYGIEDAVETVDNLIGKDVFPNFRFGGFGVVKKGDADRRIYLAFDLETSHNQSVDKSEGFLHVFWNQFNGLLGLNPFHS